MCPYCTWGHTLPHRFYYYSWQDWQMGESDDYLSPSVVCLPTSTNLRVNYSGEMKHAEKITTWFLSKKKFVTLVWYLVKVEFSIKFWKITKSNGHILWFWGVCSNPLANNSKGDNPSLEFLFGKMWDQVGVLSPHYRITALKFFIYACILGNTYYNRFTHGIFKRLLVLFILVKHNRFFLHLQRMMMLGHLRKMNAAASNNIK